MILNNDKHMLHRLVITCLEKEKIMAYALNDSLDVHVEMCIIKTIQSQQEIDYIFSSFTGASDIVVVLMTAESQAIMRKWLDQNEGVIKRRALVVIPVFIGHSDLMFDFFSFLPVVSSTGKINDLGRKLSSVISGYLNINLMSLNLFDFENLAKDVLVSYNFKEIIYSYSDHFDFGYDMMCSFNKEDVKGEIKENWLIEVKFTQKERFTIRNIESLIMKDRTRYLPDHKVMLITNGTLTSVIWDYVAELEKKQGLPILIVDGWKLCNLIAFKDNLIKEYFPHE